MLTELVVTPGTNPAVTLSAINLLDLLQQASPGVLPPQVGTGHEHNPWQLSTAQEWYWAAKNRSAERCWFHIGGRRIRVDPDDNYASDRGSVKPSVGVTIPQTVPTPSTSDQFATDKGPTYPDIYHKLAKDVDLTHVANNPRIAEQIRELLKGGASMQVQASSSLPVLTAAFFLSEVKRNYTAFHTGLMLLDLIESDATYDLHNANNTAGPLRYTWEKVLWHPEVLQAEAAIERTHPDFKQYAKDADPESELGKKHSGLIALKDGKPDTDVFGKQVTRDVRGGEHPMAHLGSVNDSKKDLTGQPKTQSLTMTRQKEANLLLRWLQRKIPLAHPGYTVTVSTNQPGNASVKEADLLSGRLGAALSATSANQADLGSAIKKKLPAFGSLLNDYAVLGDIGKLLQTRCSGLDLML